METFSDFLMEFQDAGGTSVASLSTTIGSGSANFGTADANSPGSSGGIVGSGDRWDNSNYDEDQEDDEEEFQKKRHKNQKKAAQQEKEYNAQKAKADQRGENFPSFSEFVKTNSG